MAYLKKRLVLISLTIPHTFVGEFFPKIKRFPYKDFGNWQFGWKFFLEMISQTFLLRLPSNTFTDNPPHKKSPGPIKMSTYAGRRLRQQGIKGHISLYTARKFATCPHTWRDFKSSIPPSTRWFSATKPSNLDSRINTERWPKKPSIFVLT